MNKKLFSGLALMSVAATAFWACGEGNINGKDLNDDIAMASNEQDLQTLKDNAIEDCRITPDCYLKYQGYLEGTDVPSSVDNPTSSASLTPQSSNSLIIPGLSSSIKIARSSSSINIIDDPGESSSSGPAPISNDKFGTCTAAKNPINKGDKVQWKFTANKDYDGFDPVKIAKATYTWSFAPGVVEETTGIGTTSGNVSYANSGATTASVTVMYDGTPFTVACDPLQVNGDPITCTVAAAGGDITTDAGVATWTATCTSKSEINSYVWDGTDAGPTGNSFTYTFAAKGDAHTPTLKVGNSDNTVETVTCPEVVATDASIPDYVFSDVADTIEAAGTYQIPYQCGQASQHYQPPVTLSALQDNWSGFIVSYKTSVGTGSTTSSEQHTISFDTLFGPWDKTVVFTPPAEPITITVDRKVIIKCQ